jgi:hypothetical protein
MEMTTRALWTLVHGMGFGTLYLLACSGGLLGLHRFTSVHAPLDSAPGQRRFVGFYLVLALLSWAAVLTGAYVIYPWYRAAPPTGTVDLSMFPQHLLMSSPATKGWHSLGMEWKEHVAWFAPILTTAVSFVFIRYGRNLRNHRPLRSAVLVFAVVAFFAAGVAGFFGAMLNKYAPVQGTDAVTLNHGK